MQAQTSSKSNTAKSGTVGGKSTKSVGAEKSGVFKKSGENTSGGGDSGTGGKLQIVSADGKNVTPKPLDPMMFLKDAKHDGMESSTMGREAQDDRSGDGGIPGIDDFAPPQAAPPPEKGKAVKPVGLSKDELEKTVDIILSETSTETLLHFPSLCVALDNVNSAAVSARNKAYDEIVNSKADSDQYREQHAQTLNHPHKMKEVLAAPPEQESVEVNANPWDIYDTFASDPVPKHEQIQFGCEKESATTVVQAIKKPGCLFTMNEPYPSDQPAKEPVGKGKVDGKSRTAKQVKNLSATISKSLAAGPSEVVDALGAPLSTTVGEDADGPSTAAAAETTLKKEDQSEEEVAAPVDHIPWKVGANNPIPEELSQALRVMERIVSQNVFHKQHMIYRNYPTLEELAKLDELRADEGKEHAVSISDVEAGANAAKSNVVTAEGEGGGEEAEVGGDINGDEWAARDEAPSDKASLQDLFCFDAPQLTQGMTVTCAEWNGHNEDLLAVTYGDTAPVPNALGGLVLFWSLKNPTYPERVIRTKTGVTALHFSSVHPNMVAAGTHDGSVLLWDLRRPTDVPVLKSGSSVSTHNDQKHTDIVWETRWVDRGEDKQPRELLVTVSSDGHVLQWSMKKGLEQTPLMMLKRLQNPFLASNSVKGHKEGIVFRKSSGFCIDFPKRDTSTYLVGTEDGLVHGCSTSYTEQYLDNYFGHSGPVYKVRCNPFLSHAFITCSADWTMKLWTTKPIQGHAQDQPLLTFQSTDLFDAVNDVYWAPRNSTSFAAAMDDGRVELWDLSEKPLDPIVVHYPHEGQNTRRRTCVRFSPNSPVLISGDNQGCVDVMRMYNTDVQYYSEQEQQDRLNNIMMKKR